MVRAVGPRPGALVRPRPRARRSAPPRPNAGWVAPAPPSRRAPCRPPRPRQHRHAAARPRSGLARTAGRAVVACLPPAAAGPRLSGGGGAAGADPPAGPLAPPSPLDPRARGHRRHSAPRPARLARLYPKPRRRILSYRSTGSLRRLTAERAPRPRAGPRRPPARRSLRLALVVHDSAGRDRRRRGRQRPRLVARPRQVIRPACRPRPRANRRPDPRGRSSVCSLGLPRPGAKDADVRQATDNPSTSEGQLHLAAAVQPRRFVVAARAVWGAAHRDPRLKRHRVLPLREAEKRRGGPGTKRVQPTGPPGARGRPPPAIESRPAGHRRPPPGPTTARQDDSRARRPSQYGSTDGMIAATSGPVPDARASAAIATSPGPRANDTPTTSPASRGCAQVLLGRGHPRRQAQASPRASLPIGGRRPADRPHRCGSAYCNRRGQTAELRNSLHGRQH